LFNLGLSFYVVGAGLLYANLAAAALLRRAKEFDTTGQSTRKAEAVM
jgi:hypothetical protein